MACEQDHNLGYELMGRIAQVVIKRLQGARKVLLEIQKTAGLLSLDDKLKRHGAATRIVAQTLEGVLAEHPFLREMRAQHLKILASYAMKVQFRVGELLFREGDPANRFYLIEDGEVVLEADAGERAPALIQAIGAGDVVGWSWLFPPYYWHFSARARKPTKTIFFYGTRLREECEQDHDFGYELMKRTVAVVIQRLQAARQQLLTIGREKI